MTQKILLTIEIDDAALDAAQAKADKLIATLCEAQERMIRLAQLKDKADIDAAGSSEAAT